MAIDHLASNVVAFRPFVPAKDIKVSQQFYADLGFEVRPYGPDLANMSLALRFSAAKLLCQGMGREFHDACAGH